MAIAFVQAAAGINGTGSPDAITLGSATTLGNTLIFVGGHTYLGCPVSVSDSQGNTWTKRGTTPLQGNYYYIWTAPVTHAGSTVITATYSCGAFRGSFALEYSGIDNSNPYDQQNTFSNPTSPIGCGGITTAANGALVLGMFIAVAFGAYTSTNGATTRVTDANGQTVQDQIQSTAGAIDSTGTATGINATYRTYGYMATFNAASSPPSSNQGFLQFF